MADWFHETTQSPEGLQTNLGLETKRENLIREAIQNSEDETLSGQICKIKIKLITLEGKDRKRLYDKLNIKKLNKHIIKFDSFDQYPQKAEILDSLKQKKVHILVFEDENTTGLRGGDYSQDFGKNNKFWGLVRSKYLSFKNNFQGQASQGGSYGEGKGVYWRNAGTTIVGFSSTLQEKDLPPGAQNPRFTAKSEGPTHKMKVGSEVKVHAGPGYFCETDSDENMLSIWGNEANEYCEALGISRKGLGPGTSVAMIGYRGEEEDLQNFNDEREFVELVKAVSKNFWRKLRNKIEVIVEKYDTFPSMAEPVRTEKVGIMPEIEIFSNLYQKYIDGDYNEIGDRASLKKGKLVVKNLESRLPKTKTGAPEEHNAIKAGLDLLIYVPHENEEINPFWRDHTVMFREGGPIIRYDELQNKEIGEDFYAMLIGGEARIMKKKGNKQMESYLKYCEDAGHTGWFKHRKTQLRKFYKSPHETARNELEANYITSLKKYIQPPIKEGSDAPKSLMKRFKFGTTGPLKPKSGIEVMPGSFKDGNVWKIDAKINRKTQEEVDWKAKIIVSIKGDAGSTAGQIEIKDYDFGPRGIPAGVKDELDEKGCLVISVPKEIDSVEFGLITVEDYSGKFGRILLRHTAMEA